MFRQLTGGPAGLLIVAVLAAAGAAVPLRFGASFTDPAVLLAYSAIGVLLASDATARASRGLNHAPSLQSVARAGALYGWACWAAILGAGFLSLAALSPKFPAPAPLTLASLALFSLSVSALSAAATARLSLTFENPSTARNLIRQAALFLMILVVFGSGFLPLSLRRAAARLIVSDSLPYALSAAAAILLAASWLILRSIPSALADRNASLSITGE